MATGGSYSDGYASSRGGSAYSVRESYSESSAIGGGYVRGDVAYGPSYDDRSHDQGYADERHTYGGDRSTWGPPRDGGSGHGRSSSGHYGDLPRGDTGGGYGYRQEPGERG